MGEAAVGMHPGSRPLLMLLLSGWNERYPTRDKSREEIYHRYLLVALTGQNSFEDSVSGTSDLGNTERGCVLRVVRVGRYWKGS